jgi:hypothetical protein
MNQFVYISCLSSYENLCIDETLILCKTQLNYQEDLGIVGSIVTILLQCFFLNKNHSVFVDNYYSSPGLFEYLH